MSKAKEPPKKRGRPAKVKPESAKPKAEKPRKAPDRMMLFAAEYIIEFNGTKAYKEIYGQNMSDEVAASSAVRLLRNEKVIDEIDRLLAVRKNRSAERRARVIQNLEEIAYDDLQVDVFRDKDGEVLGVSRKDRVRALELLGKTESMFTDVVKNTEPLKISVNFNPEGL